MAWPGVARTTFEIVPVPIADDLSHAVVLETDAYTIEARPLTIACFAPDTDGRKSRGRAISTRKERAR